MPSPRPDVSDGKTVCDATITFGSCRFPPLRCGSHDDAGVKRLTSRPRHYPMSCVRAKPGLPALVSSPASAKGPRRIGRRWRCRPAADTTTFAPYVVHPLGPLVRHADPQEGRSAADGSHGSGSAPTPPASRSIPPASKATPTILAQLDMIVAAGGGERDLPSTARS